jgi:RNA polymerase sigma factor (sigma-70 family)
LLRDVFADKRDSRREIRSNEHAVSNTFRSGSRAENRGPQDEVMRRERQVSVEQLVANLPKRMRDVIRLRFWERLTYRAIGERLTCSADAARMLCRRAVASLRSSAAGARQGTERPQGYPS